MSFAGHPRPGEMKKGQLGCAVLSRVPDYGYCQIARAMSRRATHLVPRAGARGECALCPLNGSVQGAVHAGQRLGADALGGHADKEEACGESGSSETCEHR